MKTLQLLFLGILIPGVFPGISWGQFGRPVPVSPPPVHGPHFFPHGGGQGHSSGDNRALWMAGGIGVVVVVGFLVRKHWKKTSTRSIQIRIIATPPGEAPEEIRRAWVGLELPLANGQQQAQVYSPEEVVSREAVGPVTGHAVEGRAAIQQLALASEDAAAWWYDHAPHVLVEGYQFIFPDEVCQRVEG